MQYLKHKGIAADDIFVNCTPFGHSDWSKIVADVVALGADGKKVGVISTINGDANVGFYKELAAAGVSAAGMTAPEREVTVVLLKELAKTRSVVAVEHDMEFIRALDCRVTVLHEGAVLAEGSMDFVTGNQQVIDVYLGR